MFSGNKFIIIFNIDILSLPLLLENSIYFFVGFFFFSFFSDKSNYEVNAYHQKTLKRKKTFNLMRFIFRNDPQHTIEFGRQQGPKVGCFSQMIFKKHISLPLHQRNSTREKSYECKACKNDFRKYSHLTNI
nr:zinc finger protein 404-like [Aotus nancymaae]